MLQQPEDTIPGLQQVYAGSPAFYALVGRPDPVRPRRRRQPARRRSASSTTPPSRACRTRAPAPRSLAPMATSTSTPRSSTWRPTPTMAPACRSGQRLSDQAIQAANRSAVIRDAVLAMTAYFVELGFCFQPRPTLFILENNACMSLGPGLASRRQTLSAWTDGTWWLDTLPGGSGNETGWIEADGTTSIHRYRPIRSSDWRPEMACYAIAYAACRLDAHPTTHEIRAISWPFSMVLESPCRGSPLGPGPRTSRRWATPAWLTSSMRCRARTSGCRSVVRPRSPASRSGRRCRGSGPPTARPATS